MALGVHIATDVGQLLIFLKMITPVPRATTSAFKAGSGNGQPSFRL